MASTWIVICPDWKNKSHFNKAHGWGLSYNDLSIVGNRYSDQNIDCIVCHKKFSLQQGVKEAFSSDIPFVINDFQFNAQETEETEVNVGQLKIIKFIEPFEDVPEVYLTPYGKHVACVSGGITNSGFVIFSSHSGTEGETGKIRWVAYGNRAYAAIPIWRKLISTSKEHQLRKDYRQELVDLESAFEVFVGEYLGKNLKTKLRDTTIDWILKRSIEEQLKIGFVEAIGNTMSGLHPDVYKNWQTNVKELRDSVVHRGVSISIEQAREARGAVFDFLFKIDPAIINYFQISMEKITQEGPCCTFGAAVIGGTK